MDLRHFEQMRCVGQGGFGKIHVVSKRSGPDTGALCKSCACSLCYARIVKLTLLLYPYLPIYVITILTLRISSYIDAMKTLGKKFIFPKPLRSINRPKSVLNMFGVEGQILAPAGAEDFNQ